MTDRRRIGPTDRRFTRRQVLGMGAAAVAAASSADLVASSTAGAQTGVWGKGPLLPLQGADALRPAIRPRSDWAGDLGVKGPLVAEDDVRFLLVHHTASSNDYGPDDVVNQIRLFYDLHTGPTKGWPDVAYNFFIDRFGGLWEGRQGSIDGPVRGDATGGSQGFALLCSLIGNHLEAPVTAEQQASLTQLLAWLAERHSIDTTPGATVDFVSRGSNLWPQGANVTARTISGHRDMSSTSCPGDFAYDLLAEQIPTQVQALRPAAAATASTTTTAAPEPTTTAPTETAAAAATTAVTESGSVSGADADIGDASGALDPSDAGDGEGLASRPLVVIGAVLGAVAAVGSVISRLWTGPDD